jgi:hypothetical protein
MNSKGLLKMNDDLSIAYPKQAYFAYQYLTSLFDSTVTASREVKVELKADGTSSQYAFLDQTSGKPVIAYWHSGAVPSDRLDTQKAALILPGVKLEFPVLVDIRIGLVYGIPESAISATILRMELGVPIYDSPLLLCEKAFLERRGILVE